MRVGDNTNILLNTLIGSFTVWAKEIKVGVYGKYVAIIRTTSTSLLTLGYVGVFATSYDCSNMDTVTNLPANTWISSTKTFSFNNMNSACSLTVSIVLAGTSSLPAFMLFNVSTKILTVSPGASDFGSYSLTASYKTIYDGMEPSLKSRNYNF